MKTVRALPYHFRMGAEHGRTGEKLVSDSAVGSRRAAWRIVTGVAQEVTTEGSEQQTTHEREYVVKGEDGLLKICNGIR